MTNWLAKGHEERQDPRLNSKKGGQEVQLVAMLSQVWQEEEQGEH